MGLKCRLCLKAGLIVFFTTFFVESLLLLPLSFFFHAISFHATIILLWVSAALLTVLILLLFTPLLFGPLLHLKKNLNAAENDAIHPERYELPIQRQDELGEIIQHCNLLLKRVGDSLRNLKAHESILELRIQERTKEVEQLANYDIITGLPNLNLLKESLKQILTEAKYENKKAVLFVLELMDFHDLTNAFGHDIGNLFLKEIGKYLKDNTPPNTMIAHITTTQFAVVRNAFLSDAQILNFAEWLLDLFEKPLIIAQNNMLTSVCIGAAVFPENGNNAETLLLNANLALERCKEEGVNTYQFYEKEINESIYLRRNLLLDLHSALEKQQLAIYYQPQVNLLKNTAVGMEALIRWNHPERGIVSPTQFISIAEDTGLIQPITEWIILNACKQLKRWHEKFPGLFVAVNLSAVQFKNKNLAGILAKILSETGLEPQFLEVEITEGIVMQHVEQAIITLRSIKAMGVSIALDDFGTGYSSLSYLTKFPINKIKIDQSFIRDLNLKEKQKNLADVIIHLCQDLNLSVIAEGIESEEQSEYLRKKGCNEAQGYLFGKPMPAEEFEKYLYENLKNKNT